jgi:hypothetical protein
MKIKFNGKMNDENKTVWINTIIYGIITIFAVLSIVYILFENNTNLLIRMTGLFFITIWCLIATLSNRKYHIFRVVVY